MVTVTVNTASGTASSADDYYALENHTITIYESDTRATIEIRSNDDAIFEGNEEFYLNLVNPMGAILSKSSGKATIIDNEAPH